MAAPSGLSVRIAPDSFPRIFRATVAARQSSARSGLDAIIRTVPMLGYLNAENRIACCSNSVNWKEARPIVELRTSALAYGKTITFTRASGKPTGALQLAFGNPARSGKPAINVSRADTASLMAMPPGTQISCQPEPTGSLPIYHCAPVQKCHSLSALDI